MEKLFTVSSEIYKQEYIDTSIEDFWEVAKINYENWNLKISGEDEDDIQEVFLEFMNYLVGVCAEA